MIPNKHIMNVSVYRCLKACETTIHDILIPAGFRRVAEEKTMPWNYRRIEGEWASFIDLQPHSPPDSYAINLALHPTFFPFFHEATVDKAPYIPLTTPDCLLRARLGQLNEQHPFDTWHPAEEFSAFSKVLESNLHESLEKLEKVSRFFTDPAECLRVLTLQAMDLELARSATLYHLRSFSKMDQEKIKEAEALPRGFPNWLTLWWPSPGLVTEFMALVAKREGQLKLAKEYLALIEKHRGPEEDMHRDAKIWHKRLNLYAF